MDTSSYWVKSATLPHFRMLDGTHKVDVVVIGAGITGTTAAYLIKNAGYTVALVERGRCGGFDTVNTTAHLTCVTDKHLPDLVSSFGNEGAQLVWDAGRAAIDQIFNIIRALDIDCDFRWIPAYLHASANGPAKEESLLLKRTAQLSRQLGFPAEFMDSVPLVDRFGVKFQHQAKFNPVKYLSALLRKIPGKGSHVFEQTGVEEIVNRPLAVRAGRNQIHCSYVVIATHTPFSGKDGTGASALFQSKLFHYTTYAVGARLPAGTADEGSFWDLATPYNYLRVDEQRGFQYAILGGEDHKTGQENNTAQAYARLEARSKRLIRSARVDSRWSGQVIETPDGLPYIGETASRQFVATGFGGNGMTFGTLGGMMALDAIERRKNPWQRLFDVHRKKFSATWKFLRENKDYPYYLLRDWLGGAERKSLRALRRNEGKILQLEGRKVAAYRDGAGKVSLCSPVCTHLKCIVKWNAAEKTWDCPCHGSRFAATGEVLAGPAGEPLEKLNPDKARSGAS